MSATALPSGQAADMLNEVLVTALTPLFLPGAGNDPAVARAAALDTLNAYCSRFDADPVLIAQAIAFGLASVSALGQSAQPDLPPDTALRLCTLANALGRTAERARQAASRQPRASAADPAPAKAASAPKRPPADGHRVEWARAFETIAQEVSDSLGGLTPAMQPAAARQSAMLRRTAAMLATPPPVET